MNTSLILFNLIKIIGVIYLIYLGIRIWQDKSIGRAQTLSSDNQIPRYKLFFEGLFISVTNPKAMAVLAAIFPSFLTDPSLLFFQASVLSITYAGLCFINHMLLIIFAKTIQKKLNSGSNLVFFRRILGGMFVGFGITLISVPR